MTQKTSLSFYDYPKRTQSIRNPHPRVYDWSRPFKTKTHDNKEQRAHLTQ